jgi:hypothetical protein
MVNVTNKFLSHIKNIFKQKNLSLSDYVFCFSCGGILDKNVSLSFLIVPISEFEDRKKEKKLPFEKFIIYKKNNCWLSCDLGAYFHLVNKRISIDNEENVVFQIVKDGLKNCLAQFVGKCLLEHMKREKLTKKELANNLKISVYKLEKIFKGSSEHLSVGDMVGISFEFEGKNKIASKYFVMVEKINQKDSLKLYEEYDLEEDDLEEID